MQQLSIMAMRTKKIVIIRLLISLTILAVVFLQFCEDSIFYGNKKNGFVLLGLVAVAFLISETLNKLKHCDFFIKDLLKKKTKVSIVKSLIISVVAIAFLLQYFGLKDKKEAEIFQKP